MGQAQGAIAAARAAGADEYAHTEIAAAEQALKNARDAVDQRDYRLALNHALESRERAQSAAKEAADQKASTRAASERAVSDLTGALIQAKATLKAADAAHVSARLLDEARERITDAEAAVQKARAVLAQGEYREVAAGLNDSAKRLAVAQRDLEAATRRRR
jgi:hypothetical protein